MALQQQTDVDKIEVVYTPFGYPVVQVRRATQVIETDTGQPVGGKKHTRQVYMPDADLSAETPDVQAAGALIFTTERKAAYAAHIASQAGE